jgi:hypothetical protein
MRVLSRRIKHPLDVTVQGSRDADAREHRRAAVAFGDEDQSFHCVLPFCGFVLGFRELGDIGPGVL